ncbi:MAG: membrane-bound lytic murein transglycosylase MltF [Ponticaulis sp.]|nr:membrane-bound lytic murein transglycosylase MltF [Ponticaulis sp.]|tara:strand:- start:2858 stop:4366 length:1509 start_codon:yes stop_codon:yes gene_type:complete
MTQRQKRRIYFVAGVALLFVLAASFNPFNSDLLNDEEQEEAGLPHGLEAIRDTGELVVLTVESPTTLQQRGSGETGYEVDLTSALADELGVDVRYKVFDDIPRLVTAIESGQGHIAAPGMTQREINLESGANPLAIGPAYKAVRHVMVCRRDGERPKSLEAVNDLSIGVVAGSGNEQTLEQKREDNPALNWKSYDVNSGLRLAEKVYEQELDCAVIDSNVAAIARRLHPELVTTFELGQQDRQLSWAIAPQSRDLNDYLKPWFQSAHQDGLLYDLDEQYYGHLNEFDYVDISVFRRRIDSRLPRYEPLFREAAGEFNLDWTMLAAQGYQESHWEADARSPTGVRGLMMLTQPTAREVGIENRLDPEQSIVGGATYLDRMYDRLPDEATGYDRLWLAMAAYNVGYGHLRDAMTLARREGLNPYKWRIIKTMLPRLTKKQYYSTVRYGYARGYEPVRYVKRIREYDTVLTNRVERPEQPPFDPDPVPTEIEAELQVESPASGTP